MDEFRIEDDNGVISTYTSESEGWAALDSAPNEDVTEWTGDLVLVRVLDRRR